MITVMMLHGDNETIIYRWGKNEARNAMILLITVVKYIGLPISVEQLCEADLLWDYYSSVAQFLTKIMLGVDRCHDSCQRTN